MDRQRWGPCSRLTLVVVTQSRLRLQAIPPPPPPQPQWRSCSRSCKHQQAATASTDYTNSRRVWRPSWRVFYGTGHLPVPVADVVGVGACVSAAMWTCGALSACMFARV